MGFMGAGGRDQAAPWSPMAQTSSQKIWVGGLSQETNKQSIDAYFSQFGEADSIVMMDGASGRSRGFGFVNFNDDSVVQTVLSMTHEIDGIQVRVDSHGNSANQRASAPPAGGMGFGGRFGAPAMAQQMMMGKPQETRDRMKIWVG